jgi:glutathione synthase/RimK-type ligase-like ATP-grasp enzyme
MLSKIGILNTDFIDYHESDDLTYENKQIIKYAKSFFEDCVLIDPTKIQIKLFRENPRILYFSSSLNKGDSEIIGKLKAIIVRRTRHFAEQTYDIIAAIHYIYPEIAIYDPPNSFIKPLSKIPSIINRAPYFFQPNTIILPNLDNFPNLANITYPVFVKPTHGFKGRETRICHNERELMSYIKRIRSLVYEDMKEKQTLGYGILIQEYIKFDEEFRVNVIGGQSIGCVAKISDKEAKNADQGAAFVEAHNAKVIEIAEKCATIQNLSFAGVDIAKKNDQYYVLECNRNPAFENFDKALNINTARLIMSFINEDLFKKIQQESGDGNNKKKSKKKSGLQGENSTNLVFHKPTIYGPVYLQSTQNDSNNTWDISNTDKIITQLLEIIKHSTLHQVTKNEALNDLKSIKELKKDISNPDVLASIERKANALNSILKNSSELASRGIPLFHNLIKILGINS